MGSKQLRSVIPELVTERSCFFTREEDGTYSRLEKFYTRNMRTNSLVEQKEKTSELRYEIVTGDVYDEVMKVQDPSGNDVIVKFKLITDM
tara:strand:+ start:791 stop:1060 length:270 start_codon:yes stop_codon:yes gene_type:complete